MRSSDSRRIGIRRAELELELLPLEVIRAPPLNVRRPQGRPRTLEDLHSHSGLGTPGDPPGAAGMSCFGVRRLKMSCLNLLPSQPDPG